MRISDWSSDVCSSDLVAIDLARTPCDDQRWIVILRIVANREARPAFATTKPEVVDQRVHTGRCHVRISAQVTPGAERSEEHTSELKSLMRISYAVFCLKKNKQTINRSTKVQQN